MAKMAIFNFDNTYNAFRRGLEKRLKKVVFRKRKTSKYGTGAKARRSDFGSASNQSIAIQEVLFGLFQTPAYLYMEEGDFSKASEFYQQAHL